MSRIKQGWYLTKKSWVLLRSHKQLFRFPIFGSLAMLAVAIITVAPGVYLIEDDQRLLGGLLVAIGIYLSSFIATYFAVGLAATADEIFHGREASFGDGIGLANKRLGAIAGWAALSALVGSALGALRAGGSVGEAIVGSLGAAAWGLITFLAVPVIAIENLGPWATLKRSARLFKERWAGQVTGNVAIGGIVLLAGMLPAVLLIALGVVLWVSDDGGGSIAAGAVIFAIGIVLLGISLLIVNALRGIFGVALYRFASTGETPAGFTDADLESAVRTRGHRRDSSTA